MVSELTMASLAEGYAYDPATIPEGDGLHAPDWKMSWALTTEVFIPARMDFCILDTKEGRWIGDVVAGSLRPVHGI